MDILIQDQTFSESFSLHEALVYACEGATEGSGAFAFVSASGVELFLNDPSFQTMISQGQYKLIVGTDAITDVAALQKLQEQADQHASLEILAFLNNSRALFHPKCAWFKHANGGTIIVGSGNLTVGGLRKNREIFSAKDVSSPEINELKLFWERWLTESEPFLKPIDDEAVVRKAEANGRKRSAIRRAITEPVTEEEDVIEAVEEPSDDYEEWKFSENSEVLIAEIPRSDVRWNQANFDANTFRSFFGATPGESGQRILLRHIGEGGHLNEIESRPSVSVRSKNYRFELAAAGGKDVSFPIR